MKTLESTIFLQQCVHTIRMCEVISLQVTEQYLYNIILVSDINYPPKKWYNQYFDIKSCYLIQEKICQHFKTYQMYTKDVILNNMSIGYYSFLPLFQPYKIVSVL